MCSTAAKALCWGHKIATQRVLFLWKFAWPLAKGVSRPCINHPHLIHKSTNRFFILSLLDLSSIPRAREGAPGGPRRQSWWIDRGLNGGKPLLERLLALLGGYLALFDATLLHDALSCLYFLCFVTILGSFLLLFEIKNH